MDGLSAVVVRRVSTAQQVADGLTEMILNGKMSPGEPLKESAIAATLGISRNTVREAVRILEQGGLVRRQEMHRGATVIEPSDEELADLHRARMLLEVAGTAATTTPEAVAAVRAAYDAMARAAELHELELLVQRDLDFHAAIVAQLGSRLIDAFYGQLARELRYFLMVLSAEDREYQQPAKILHEHGQIMQALEAGQIAEAQQLTAVLIQENEQRVRSIFQQRSQA
jgi:DNA-binding GntR family transcriptional regulator